MAGETPSLAALKQYQGEGDGEDEHTPALFLEAPYRVGKPLRTS